MTIAIVLSVISLCLCVSGFFFCRWYIARKTAARELLADYRTEVYRLIAEIDAAADRDSLLVEERIKTLKQLLDDTDRRIGVYMRELQRSRHGEVMYASLGRGIRAALDSRTPQLDLIPPEPQPPAQTTPLPPPHEPPIPVTVTDKSEGPPASPRPPEQPFRKRGAKKTKVKMQIAEMAAQGLPPQKIASRLHLTIAEVDLAMNLLHRAGGGET
jgi:hypothetical protein